MAKYKIYNINGEFKCDVKSLEYSGKWMGDNFINVSVTSPTPIQFEIGDYLDYRGIRYVLSITPSVSKNHSSLSRLDSYAYDSIKFMGPNDDLTRCMFLDYVAQDSLLGEEKGLYSNGPTFEFFCEDVTVLAERMQVNLNRLYDNWEVVATTEPFESAHNIHIQVDKLTVWDAALLINTKFKTSFVIKQYVNEEGKRINRLVIGETLVLNNTMLEQGKGNGLASIERSKDDGTNVVNRLRVYGSQKNIPTRYYNEIYDPWFKMPVRKGVIYNTSVDYPLSRKLTLPLSESELRFKGCVVVFGADKSKKHYIAKLVFDSHGDTNNGYGFISVNHDYWYADDIPYEERQIFESGYNELLIVSGFSKTDMHLERSLWYNPRPLAPYEMALSRLMLPSFLNYYGVFEGKTYELPNFKTDKTTNASGNVISLYYEGKDYEPIYIFDEEGNHLLDENGHWMLKLNTDPCIEDAESIAKYGIREGVVFFDSEDDSSDTPEIYPTITGITKDLAEGAGYVINIPSTDNGNLDEVFIGTDNEKYKIEDDGVIDADPMTENPNGDFYIEIKDLGFDLKDYLSDSSAIIKMTSGDCGGREFELINNNNNPIKMGSSNYTSYQLALKRSLDQTLNRYFPNKDYTIRSGDTFVLLNIDLPRLYVDVASERLRVAGEEYLAEHCVSQVNIIPTLDNIKLAREYDEKGINSLYYNLREGCILQVADESLGIEVNGNDKKHYIDNLTIKEAEGKVPVVELKLVKSKEYSTIQKLKNEIEEVKNGGAAGITRVEAQEIAESATNTIKVGGENFLLNSGFNGNYKSLQINEMQVLSEVDTLYGELLEYWDISDASEVLSIENESAKSGRACSLTTVGSWIQQEVTLIPKEEYLLSFKCSGRVSVVDRYCGVEGEEKLYKINLVGSGTTNISFVAVSENLLIWDVMLERGNVRTDWTPSHKDTNPVADEFRSLQYLQDALKGKTEILGGLILSSMLQLGNYRNGEMEQVTAGVSGITSTPEIDVAFWGGGTFEQAIKAVNMFRNNPSYQPTEEEVASIAKAVITHGGRAILNDIVLRGYIYALGGVFKGRVEAKEGYFLGSTRSIMTEITPENVSQYAISGNGTVGNPYDFDFDKTGVCVRFKGNLGNIYFGLPYMTPTIPASSLERDKFRTRDFSRVLMYNNTTADSNVGVSLRSELSSVKIPRDGWVEFCGKIIYDYNNDKGFGVGERLSWSYIIYNPSEDGPMEASLD